MKAVKQNSRFLIVDAIRGFTVILMIIFHFYFDLDYYGLIDIDIIHHPFWFFFPRLIVFLFLFATGISLSLAHADKIKWDKFLKRLGLLLFWALVISAVTFYMFPNSWIYFGTLHAIAVISCMSLPFLKYPRLALVVAMAFFIPSIIWDITLPWFQLPHASWDYISPFPWVGASLLGVFAMHKGLPYVRPRESFMTNTLKFLGQHSLIIYLIHQPILFGLLGLYSELNRS